MWSIVSGQKAEWRRVDSGSGGSNRDYPAQLYMDYLIDEAETFVIPILDVETEGSAR